MERSVVDNDNKERGTQKKNNERCGGTGGPLLRVSFGWARFSLPKKMVGYMTVMGSKLIGSQ